MFTFCWSVFDFIDFLSENPDLELLHGSYFVKTKYWVYFFKWDIIGDFILRYLSKNKTHYSYSKERLLGKKKGMNRRSCQDRWIFGRTLSYGAVLEWKLFYFSQKTKKLKQLWLFKSMSDSHRFLNVNTSTDAGTFFGKFWLMRGLSLQKPFNHIDIYKYGYVLSPVNISSFFRDTPVVSTWMDRKWEIAEVKALSELFERYSCALLPNDREEMPKLIITQNEIDIVSKYLWVDISAHKGRTVLWVPFRVQSSFFEKEICLLPSSVALYMNDSLGADIYRGNSNWVAVHTTYSQATISAYLEILERDSIACTHLFKIPLPKVDLNEFSHHLSWFQLEAANRELKIHVFDASLDKNIHIFLCAVENLKDEFPKYVFWSSAGFDVSITLEKAILEALYSSVSLQSKKDLHLNYYNSKSNSPITSTLDHLYFYANPQNGNDIQYLFSNSNYQKYLRMPKDIYDHDEISLVLSHGDRVLQLDTTTVSMNSLGLYGTKLISEKFLPFWFWETSFPCLKIMSRYHDLKKCLAILDLQSRTYEEMNADPKKYLHFLW